MASAGALASSLQHQQGLEARIDKQKQFGDFEGRVHGMRAGRRRLDTVNDHICTRSQLGQKPPGLRNKNKCQQEHRDPQLPGRRRDTNDDQHDDEGYEFGLIQRLEHDAADIERDRTSNGRRGKSHGRG